MDHTTNVSLHTEPIQFSAEGCDLYGTLYLPSTQNTELLRAVVMTGPFTGVQDQVVKIYAERFARAGVAALCFDHRGFGRSSGAQGHEDAQGKLSDVRAALSVLAQRDEIDSTRIGVVGVCLGGGYAVRAAAQDPRVKAVAGIAGGYNSPGWFIEQMGITAYRSALSSFLERYDEYMPAVAPDGGEAAMGGDEPYEYYGTQRSASEYWENRVTRGSLHTLMTLDVLSAAPMLADTPLLIVHGKEDAYCSPELAEKLYADTSGEKEIVWLDTKLHIDLYDVEPHVTHAADATIEFLQRRL